MKTIKEIVDEMVAMKAVFGADNLGRKEFRSSTARFLRCVRVSARQCTATIVKISSMYEIDFIRTYNHIKRDFLELLHEEVSQHYAVSGRIYNVVSDSEIGRVIVEDSF